MSKKKDSKKEEKEQDVSGNVIDGDLKEISVVIPLRDFSIIAETKNSYVLKIGKDHFRLPKKFINTKDSIVDREPTHNIIYVEVSILSLFSMLSFHAGEFSIFDKMKLPQ